MTKARRVCSKCSIEHSVLAFATRTGSICRWCKEAEGKSVTTHLCLTCRHAMWQRKNGRLTGVGFCEAPDPDLPKLPAAKWWAFATHIGEIRGGYLDRRTANPVEQCHFYDRAKP